MLIFVTECRVGEEPAENSNNADGFDRPYRDSAKLEHEVLQLSCASNLISGDSAADKSPDSDNKAFSVLKESDTVHMQESTVRTHIGKFTLCELYFDIILGM